MLWLFVHYLLCAPTTSHLFIQGLPLTPFASDNLGRRATLFLGSLIMLAGVALQFAAPSVWIFIAARILSERESPTYPQKLIFLSSRLWLDILH